METTTSDSSSSPVWTRSLLARGGVAVVLSVGVNVALVLLADAVGIAPDFRAISIPPVAFLSALGAIGATVVYALLDRYVADRDRTFRRLAAGVLVASFVPDLALLSIDPEATVPGVLLLMIMHVVVATISVGSLLRGGEP